MSALVCPDQVVVEPVGTALTNPHTRRPLGRRASTTVTVLAQLELGRDRKDTGDSVIDRNARGEIVFDSPPLTPAGLDANYTPERGDRVNSVIHAEGGATESMGLYLEDCKPDGAGALIRCTLVDRQPAREDA